MQVTFVLPGSGISGGVRTTQRFATGLLERGHDVSICYGRGSPGLLDLAKGLYVRMRYPDNRDWLRRFAGRLQPYRQLTADFVRKNDLVVAVGPWAARSVATLPDWCGIKVEHVRGSAQPREIVMEAWRHPWPKIVCADHLRRAIEAEGCGPVVDVVPHGVDTEEYFPDPSAVARLGVGTVWHRGRAKDPEAILAVFERIHARRADIPLYMFGHHRRPVPLPSNVKFVRYPSISVARKIFSQCKVWFCASRTEGSPNPILESMACGCAVVSTDCGGSSPFVEDGCDGFMVPVGDVDALTARILQLLDDEELLNRFVARSRQRVKSLSWSVAVDKLEFALEKILSSDHARACTVATG